jgi:hypothetical protein
MAAPVAPFLLGIMAWGVYRRVRRNIGRQPLRLGRIIVSLVVLLLVSALLIGLSLAFPKLLLGFGGGILLGAPLGFLGLRLTKFETTDQGHFFTPNTHIGIALSLLVVGRMIYRYWMFQGATAMGAQPQLFQSPLTLLIVGLTVGYYLVYRIGLFVHLHDKKQLAQ